MTPETDPTSLYWPTLAKILEEEPSTEEKIEILRIFTKKGLAAIQKRETEVTLLDLFRTLTGLAEAVLLGSFRIFSEELRSRHPPQGDFAVIAMGKFGGRELTYRSDLDIIYLFEKPEDQEYYTRLGTRIITGLTLVTREGVAYQIDAALRPSGNRGTLVSSLDAFEEYHKVSGRIWERQSLLKARPIPLTGSPKFLERLLQTFWSISYQKNDPKQVASEIHTLRMRMENELAREKTGRYNLKTGPGGIVDIEFLTQYLQLLHGGDHPSLRLQNTVGALRALHNEGLLSGESARRLEEAYLFYREIETRLRQKLERPTDEIVEEAPWMKEMETTYFGGRSLVPEILACRREVRELYRQGLEV